MEKETNDKIEKMVFDFLNDRGARETLRINYVRPTKEEIEKVRDYVKRFYAPWEGTRW